jgi:hypothetical protein
MSLIKPSFDLPEPLEESVTTLISREQYDRIIKFLDIPNWLCPICGLTNFGRNEKCADWRCNKERPK